MITVLRDYYVSKTRKDWQCDGCFRDFEAGTGKYVQVNVFDGNIGTVTWCETCRQLANQLFADDLTDENYGVSADHLYEAMLDFGSWDEADAHFREVKG